MVNSCDKWTDVFFQYTVYIVCGKVNSIGG